MARVVYVVLVCFSVFVIVCSGPATTSGITNCFKVACPEDTYACEKKSKISEDKANIIEEIHCLGFSGEVLKKETLSEKNPFDSNTYFQGYSYSRAYELHGGEVVNHEHA